ncbi:MAG TPA: DoxX family membrane protein [Candidatus Marinimicrobia bacterium]|nr:DoxX family membrane protein [Candidatus Neomarinimicrobiota bacterium]HIM12494.1 DoxX family membrane protein [Candidatus Poribacteria bacterium]
MTDKNYTLSTSNVIDNLQLYGLVTLRVLIGWHLLYEGIAKLLNPYWSSAAFLLDAKWIFSGVAEWMVATPSILSLVDNLNIWGLTLIGACLMLGLFGRHVSLAGMLLVLVYYLFTPSFWWLEYARPGEGSYLVVNKNLIEACALFVIYLFPTSKIIGLDRLLFNNNSSN